MNFYKHHIGDYAQATAHLTFLEDAAYSRLIRKYYAEEKPLPVDIKAVQRVVAARSRDERQAVENVLSEFFELESDGWHNKRCDEEIAKANAQADTNREIARNREAAKAAKKEAAKASLLVNENQTNRSVFVNTSLNDSLDDSSLSREPSQTPDTRLIEKSSHHSTIPAVETAAPIKTESPEPKGTPEGRMAVELIKLGVAVTSINPKLAALIKQGVTIGEAVECVGIARTYKPAPEKISIGYLESIIISQRNQRPSGTIAEKPSAGKPWFLSADAIARKAWDLGLLTKTLTDRKEIEDPAFHAKVFKAAGISADEVDRARAEWEEKISAVA